LIDIEPEPDDPFTKQAGKWCEHCKPGAPGGGCTIYQQRPNVCRDYQCGWLGYDWIPEYWFPRKSKMIVHPKRDALNGTLTIQVTCDIPGVWRKKPYITDIKNWLYTWSESGVPCVVYIVESNHLTTALFPDDSEIDARNNRLELYVKLASLNIQREKEKIAC
jgi:hypothetical protein